MRLPSRLKPNSLRDRIRRDRVTDIRELLEIEQRQWGPRMRLIGSHGEPMAGLGFTGIVVPNNEVVTSPASTTNTAETTLYTGASVGSQTWMWIPAGTFRAPQSFRVWAAGLFTTTATTQTFTWTTRVGSVALGGSVNGIFGATGAMAPGSVGAGSVATGALWWYEAHMTVRTPGAPGTVMGTFNVEMANSGSFTPATNTATGIGGTGTAGLALDTTQGAAWTIDVANSTTSAAVQLSQFMIVAWD